MNGYEKFTELIVEKATTLIKSRDQDELLENMKVSLTGVGKKSKPPRLTKEEKFYIQIFRHFVEIDTSLENLDYIPVFIKKPFRKSKAYQEAGITRNSYLRYHIEHYLEENNILKNRVIRFLNNLSKMFSEEGRLEERKIVLKCKGWFLESMKNLTEIRRSHVHEIRFDDDDLSRLHIFELTSTYSEDEDLELAATLSYELVKKEWSERIINNNKTLREVIDAVFGSLLPIVFPSEGQVAR